jgi:hypothetical protein
MQGQLEQDTALLFARPIKQCHAGRAGRLHWIMMRHAVNNKDTGEAHCWASAETLATELGYDLNDHHERQAGLKAVQLGRRDLESIGAVTLIKEAKPGRSADYKINLTPFGERDILEWEAHQRRGERAYDGVDNLSPRF